SLGKIKRPGQLLVGFALETDNEITNAVDKLHRKNLDMIVLNSLRVPGAGFRTDTNQISICYPDGVRKDYSLKTKREVAADIIDAIAEL
ncbi:MAG: phosphopantothenoylcysteine decarboxylase, partial [Muribaculaceae bacterium]|nr:phosphopantothenoylcysteine decarboxylase [Muribaculaceae bacterium]